MLERLLRIVAAEGAGSVSALARHLGVSEQLAAAMLEDLGRQGYLMPFAMGCRGQCAHCPLRTGCRYEGRLRLWVLSRKSERLLAERDAGGA